MVAGPRNQNSFPFNSLREPCNHPNLWIFVAKDSFPFEFNINAAAK